MPVEQRPDVEEAVVAILRGELIGLPTETVYGLAGNASNRAAIDAIYRVKGRPTDHPLIVHVASSVEARNWGVWNDAAERLATAFWPGPLTLVLERRPGASPLACAGQSTVALRVPSHPVAQRLLRRLHEQGVAGLAAPSANRFGRVSPTRASHVRSDLGDAVAIVLDGGDAEVGIESTIVDLSRLGCRASAGAADAAKADRAALILRPGHLSAAGIGAVLGVDPRTLDGARAHAQQVADAQQEADGEQAADGQQKPRTREQPAARPRVPGSHRSHYAPVTPLRIVAGEALDAAISEALQTHSRIAVWSADRRDGAGLCWLERPATLEAAEHTLYASLRKLDAFNAQLILIERFQAIDAELRSEDPAWAGIADRLRRAAAAS